MFCKSFNIISVFSKSQGFVESIVFIMQILFNDDSVTSRTMRLDVFDAYHEVIADAMKAGDKVVIPGVLKVEVKEMAARTGRNPQTGEEMQIPAKKAIKAKFSDKLLG